MLKQRGSGKVALACLVGFLAGGTTAQAAPPVPSGTHPRLFMGTDNLAAFTANAANSTKLASLVVKACDNIIQNPQYVMTRGGAGGGNWPASAMNCAFAYLTTQSPQYLTQAIKYWRAALNDDQVVGDNLGCKPGVDTNWQSWNGNSPVPPALITIAHDTGYPMRWYGPYVALTYDWLYSAPGVDAALLAQTRTCLTTWMDYYSARGYLRDEAGANYNAGFVIGKALASIAIGNDGGADGHLWTEVTDDLFPRLLIGDGLNNHGGTLGMPAGGLVGGDWPEGWQYGPLSVVEYAVAARAVEEHGMALPEMDAWVNSLAVRSVHGLVPTRDGQWPGGDFDSERPYQFPTFNQLDAVLAGPSSDQAAAWAAFEKKDLDPGNSPFIYNVLAELRQVAPQDYRAQTPAPPLWYLARGTRTMYARTSWDPGAYWGVFVSAPRVVADHSHWAASNFVFTRGADHLIVDPSTYGTLGTLATNAVTADSTNVTGNYAPSQTPWTQAELVWARGSQSLVFAARSDFATAFNFADRPSDIKYAHREWTMLPEGEVVTIDRVRTGAAERTMYVNFHANTAGTLTRTGNVATGTVGGSKVAIHTVMISGGTPEITRPPNTECTSRGGCISTRFVVDKYSVRVPGPFATAIHVIDGLPTGEEPALTGSLNDDNFDPAPKQNAGVIGAAVYRGSKQTYVVASSAEDGLAGATMTYSVPGASAARHVVFDAPEDGGGKSMVTASAAGDRCTVNITAGSGYVGRPLIFVVGTAAGGCTLSEDGDVPVGQIPPGGGVTPKGPTTGTTGGGGSEDGGGCGCTLSGGGVLSGAGALAAGTLAAAIAAIAIVLGRARRPRRFFSARASRSGLPRR